MVDGHLDSFPFGAIGVRTAVNILEHAFWGTRGRTSGGRPTVQVPHGDSTHAQRQELCQTRSPCIAPSARDFWIAGPILSGFGQLGESFPFEFSEPRASNPARSLG